MSIRVRRGGKWINATTQQVLDKTLSVEGLAADSKAVGDRIDDLPIAIYEDVSGNRFTEISGIRQTTGISFSKEGNVISVVTKLEGDIIVTSLITLDENGYPINIETNELDCAISWEGFDNG